MHRKIMIIWSLLTFVGVVLFGWHVFLAWEYQMLLEELEALHTTLDREYLAYNKIISDRAEQMYRVRETANELVLTNVWSSTSNENSVENPGGRR